MYKKEHFLFYYKDWFTTGTNWHTLSAQMIRASMHCGFGNKVLYG